LFFISREVYQGRKCAACGKAFWTDLGQYTGILPGRGRKGELLGLINTGVMGTLQFKAEAEETALCKAIV